MLDLEKLKETTVNLTNVGWNYTLENICGKFGWYLVNVHSKLEQDFVGFFLQHRVQGSNRRHILEPDGYYGYAYLGKCVFIFLTTRLDLWSIIYSTIKTPLYTLVNYKST